jgi:hypothetical protein
MDSDSSDDRPQRACWGCDLQLIDGINNGLADVGADAINVGETTSPVRKFGTIIARERKDWLRAIMCNIDWARLGYRVGLAGNETTTLTPVDATTLGSYTQGDSVTATRTTAFFTFNAAIWQLSRGR